MSMSEEEKINIVKLTSEETDEDIVSFYLKNAEEVILHQAFPYGDGTEEMPSRYEMLQCRIAVALIAKRGAESELHHSENGILRIYETADIPESMLREIVPKAVVM